jgi:exosortase H (IPTLxxWG-CTERM-specific)
MALFYAGTLTGFFKHTFFPALFRLNAKVASALLCLLGQGTTAADTTIVGPGFSLIIRRGCDGLETTALFVAAVLAFPSPWRKKLLGLLVGTVFLLGLNILRIVSLFFIGVYFPKLFQVMHADVWQVAFILVAVIFWALWIQWATAAHPAAKANSQPTAKPAA